LNTTTRVVFLYLKFFRRNTSRYPV